MNIPLKEMRVKQASTCLKFTHTSLYILCTVQHLSKNSETITAKSVKTNQESLEQELTSLGGPENGVNVTGKHNNYKYYIDLKGNSTQQL